MAEQYKIIVNLKLLHFYLEKKIKKFNFVAETHECPVKNHESSLQNLTAILSMNWMVLPNLLCFNC